MSGETISLLSPMLFSLAAEEIKKRGWIRGEEVSIAGVCLTGAIKVCNLEPGDWLLARAVMRHRKHAEEWNDHGQRKKDEVIEWLTDAAPITCAELEAVFGPCYKRVAWTIRAMASASPEQPSSLAAAWSAAWDASREAAWGAAWDASWDASWAAVREAARAAAWSVTRATVVHDLIGEIYTQEQSDLLTGPFEQVFGPIGDVEFSCEEEKL